MSYCLTVLYIGYSTLKSGHLTYQDTFSCQTTAEDALECSTALQYLTLKSGHLTYQDTFSRQTTAEGVLECSTAH